VLLNGAVETRKRKKLAAGDKVTFAGQTIIVGG
jgi:ribosome-associated protein YbcJ (S4-like RNA binding protein)